METIKGTEGQDGRVCLGNFLSGMETAVLNELSMQKKALGNFLSGMETTCVHTWGIHHVLPLETSLVEWKLFSVSMEEFPLFPWKLP